MFIVAMIPACNEPDIGKAIDSVFGQTIPPRHVIVITNNCTDNGETKRIAKEHGAKVIDIGISPGRKAGAMNQGFRIVRELYPKVKYILQMDADTILDKNFVQRTYRAMSRNLQIGGLSASFIGQSKKGENLLGSFLVWGQRQEFAHFHTGQLQQQTSVMSGTACLIRVKPLNQIETERGYVWDEDCIVEDYELTKAMQDRGWLCMTDISFLAYTDVMTSWTALIKQRRRWQSGTLDVIFRRYKGSHCTKTDAWKQRITHGAIVPEIAGYIVMVVSILSSGRISLAFSGVWIVLGLYNLWATRKAGWKIALIAGTLVPLILYNFVRYWWLILSYKQYRMIPNTSQTW